MKQYREGMSSWMWHQSNRIVSPNTAISHLCDFAQFSRPFSESPFTCVEAVFWKSYGNQVTEWKEEAEKQQASEINEIRAVLGVLVAEMTVSSGSCPWNDEAPALCVPVSCGTAKS